MNNGLEFAKVFDMGLYEEPKQFKQSRGLHYILGADGEQSQRIGSIARITYKSLTYTG